MGGGKERERPKRRKKDKKKGGGKSRGIGAERQTGSRGEKRC